MRFASSGVVLSLPSVAVPKPRIGTRWFERPRIRVGRDVGPASDRSVIKESTAIPPAAAADVRTKSRLVMLIGAPPYLNEDHMEVHWVWLRRTARLILLG